MPMKLPWQRPWRIVEKLDDFMHDAQNLVSGGRRLSLKLVAAFAIGFVVLCMFGKILPLSMHFLWQLITNSIVGVVALWFVKLFASKVEITFLSALITGFFGVPGVIAILVYTYLLK